MSDKDDALRVRDAFAALTKCLRDDKGDCTELEGHFTSLGVALDTADLKAGDVSMALQKLPEPLRARDGERQGVAYELIVRVILRQQGLKMSSWPGWVEPPRIGLTQ